MAFPRQEYWSGLPFVSPEDLPDPRIELASLMSPVLAEISSPLALPGEPKYFLGICYLLDILLGTRDIVLCIY